LVLISLFFQCAPLFSGAALTPSKILLFFPKLTYTNKQWL